LVKEMNDRETARHSLASTMPSSGKWGGSVGGSDPPSSCGASWSGMYRLPQLGEPVMLSGSTNRPHLNGTQCKVVGEGLDGSGRVTVRVCENDDPACSGQSRKLKVQLSRLKPVTSRKIATRSASMPVLTNHGAASSALSFSRPEYDVFSGGGSQLSANSPSAVQGSNVEGSGVCLSSLLSGNSITSSARLRRAFSQVNAKSTKPKLWRTVAGVETMDPQYWEFSQPWFHSLRDGKSK